RTIHGKVTARSAAQTVLFGIGLQGEFTHQFGPAVGVVRVIGALGEVFGEVEFLVDIGLQKVGVHTAGRSKDHFFHFGFQGLGKDEPVQKKIRRRAGLVQIHITAATVVGGKVKNHVRSEEHTSELQSRENLVCR